MCEHRAMGTHQRTASPIGGGTPPPVSADDLPIDEGPMRRGFLRQIAELDARLGRRGATWKTERSTPLRGPALQPTSELERIRDELLTALGAPRS